MIMAFGRGYSFGVVGRYPYKNFDGGDATTTERRASTGGPWRTNMSTTLWGCVADGLTSTAPGDIHLVTSIDGLDDETHPSPNLAFYHRHHDDARLAKDPRRPALLFTVRVRRKRELEMLHQGRDDDEHFQDAACSIRWVPRDERSTRGRARR